MDGTILKRYATTIMDYSLSVQKGDLLVIQAYAQSAPLVEQCYKEALIRGAHPYVITRNSYDELLYEYGSDEQLAFENPIAKAVFENATKLLNIGGGDNTRYLSGIDPKKMAYHRKSMFTINEIYKNRVDQGKLDWTLCMYPTQALAQEAGMSLRNYEKFIEKACFLDQEDPIQKWKELHDRQQGFVEVLDQKKTLRIRSRETDVTMNIKGRKWINSDGKTNFPSGEVFTAPHRESVEGKVRFSYPGIYAGQEIEDIQLVFEKGKVVQASAQKGEALLKALLDTDEGARYVGEVALGTNYGIDRFTKNMLFDEKIGGTMHMALGKAYKKSGGENDSAIHWDMLCDMKEKGEVLADGELIYKNGEFIL